MRNFLRVLALLLTLVVVILIPLSLLGLEFGQHLYSPSNLLNLIAEKIIGPGLTIDIIQDSIRELPGTIGLGEDSILTPAFDFAADQVDYFRLLLPPEIQIEYTAQILENLFLWYNSQDSLPFLILDMQPYREYLSQNGSLIATSLFNQMPPCTAEDTFALAGSILNGLLSGEGGLEAMPACIPPLIPLDSLVPAAGELLKQQAGNIPDTIFIEQLFKSSSESMLDLKARLHLAEGILLWSWLPLAFLLLLAAFAGGQTTDGFLKWLGWSLTATGILTFLITLIPSTWWAGAINSQLDSWSTAFRRLLSVLLIALFEQAKQPIPWYAAGLFIGGIVFIALGYFWQSRTKKV